MKSWLYDVLYLYIFIFYIFLGRMFQSILAWIGPVSAVAVWYEWSGNFILFTFNNDIALLRRSEEVSPPSDLRLASLPPPGEILPHNHLCHVTGHGRISSESKCDSLLTFLILTASAGASDFSNPMHCDQTKRMHPRLCMLNIYPFCHRLRKICWTFPKTHSVPLITRGCLQVCHTWSHPTCSDRCWW